MTDELLIISETEAKEINVALKNIDLADFCQELITEFAQIYPDYQFQFKSNISSLKTKIDCRLLRSVLTNILTNARQIFSERSAN